MSSQPMNMQQMNMGQKVDTVANILSYPVLTILPFVRSRVGYRTLRPFQIVLMFLLMQSIPQIFDQHCTLVNGCSALPNGGLSAGYYYFTWVFLIGGLLLRQIRWWELRHGKLWHTFSRGVSRLEFLSRFEFRPGRFVRFIPHDFVLRVPSSAIYRFGDAIAVACIAMAIGDLPGMKGLARWMFFASICMLFVENYVYDKQVDRELDLLDSMFEGEISAQVAHRFSGAQREQVAAPSLMETAGIPTGLGPDIMRQVNARRSTSRVTQLDAVAAE